MRFRNRTSRLALGLLGVGLLFACSNEPAGPASSAPGTTTGALNVTAPATGNGIPATGGTVTVDDTAPRPLALNGTVSYAALGIGNHAVAFNGLQAPNCSITGSNPVTVTVQPGATAYAAFPTTCVGIGSIAVTFATTGVDLDADGYSLLIPGAVSYGGAPTNGTITLTGIQEGTYSGIQLSGVAPNCTPATSNPTTVTVANGQTSTLALAVTCVAFGAIQVTATTSGVDLDADGYTAVAGLALGGGIAVPTNGSATFTQVGPGTQNVTLSGFAPNCSVVGTNPVSVTVASGATSQVQFAMTCTAVLPTGSAIAFTSLRDGNAEVYVLRAGASFTAINLTNNVAADVAPTWSPDGLALAFVTSRDLNDEIYKMNADGSAPVNLTLRAGSDEQPAWSPDGSKVAFVSTRNDQGDSVPAEIFVMAPDGSGTRTALTANSGGSTSPAWSPDGTHIAFVTVRDGNAEIYVMNGDGSAPINLTNNAAADDHPVWSPDGTRIAFVSDRGGRTAAYVMRADGTGLTAAATAIADDYASWSPDGGKLALAAGGILVANADGSGTTQLVFADGQTRCYTPPRGRGGCSNASAATPAWSPDGTRIAYHLTTRSCGGPPCTPRNPQSSIRIMNPDGTRTLVLTSEASVGAVRPVWKP